VLTIAYARPADFLARVPFDCKIDSELIRIDEVLDDPKVMLAVSNDLARSAPEARWNGRPPRRKSPCGWRWRAG